MIGGWWTGLSIIRIGDLDAFDGPVSTPGILNSTTYTHHWLSWDNGAVRFGTCFTIGDRVVMQKSYPSTIEVRYMAVFNGFGSNGDWVIYAGRVFSNFIHIIMYIFPNDLIVREPN